MWSEYNATHKARLYMTAARDGGIRVEHNLHGAACDFWEKQHVKDSCQAAV